MPRFRPLHLVPALFAAATHAGEVTIQPQPFSVRHTFTATALPAKESGLLELAGRSWSGFKIKDIAAHGSRAAKGDSLIVFESEGIDKQLHDLRGKIATDTLALQQAELDYKHLEETSPNRLEALRQAAAIAKEENAYFLSTRRKAREETAAQTLKRTEQILGNQQEELSQLTKMYEADDLTEETEEIILERQRHAVAAAEFALRMEFLNHRRTLDVLLPREAKSLADSERDTALALEKAEAETPRTLKIKKLELDTLKTSLAREKERLADLEADRKDFEFKAPADGWFYYGPIQNGRWNNSAETLRTLVSGGTVAPQRPFATFIPETSDITLVAFVDATTARSLNPEAAGVVNLAGREDLEIPATLVSLATTPEPDGTFRADLAATWPEDFTPIPGTSAQLTLIAYEQEEAISVPTKALDFGGTGWTIEVKLADGKTERRPVKRGRVSGDNTEILSGLEAGQVIVVP